MESDSGFEIADASVQAWLQELSGRTGTLASLVATLDARDGDGFQNTLREICQQPATWPITARRLIGMKDAIAASVSGCERIVLTGSGSSQYAAECIAGLLQRELRTSVEVMGGGELLLRRRASVRGEPALVVSLARSGDSPESATTVETLLREEAATRHLIVTCNSEGKLARQFTGNERVTVIRLPGEVNDRSLVMTSSFTNLVLGGRFLGCTDREHEFLEHVKILSRAGRKLLADWADRLQHFVSGARRMVFLGHGGHFGAARESSLKLLEMTGGRVATLAQSYLGLRHGPMCFIDEDTLIVCFLSSDPLIRKYEADLIRELNAKGLGARKLIAGTGDPGAGLAAAGDLTIPHEVPQSLADAELSILNVMIGQILGFYRCREEGLLPDSPSVNGIISRVVGQFRIYPSAGGARQ